MHGAAALYARHFVHPQCDAIGEGCELTRPWGLDVIGPNIRIGRAVHISSAPGYPTKLCVWKGGESWGALTIEDYVLISPGTQIISSIGITIGANTMIATGCYISDSDWHGTYDRLREAGQAKPVVLGRNVWLGVRVIVGKGVTIGDNSIVGAGSVVTRDIPANVIAAGNPATVKRDLDPNGPFHMRAELLGDQERLTRFTVEGRRAQLKDNTTLGWLRASLFPGRDD